MRVTDLIFNGVEYSFIEGNNFFKIYMNGEIVKSHIHLDYFPSTLFECSEILSEYGLNN
jgi:hypothetical protein